MNCEQSVLLETTFNKLFDRKYKKKKTLSKTIQNVLVYAFAKILTDIDQNLFMYVMLGNTLCLRHVLRFYWYFLN